MSSVVLFGLECWKKMSIIEIRILEWSDRKRNEFTRNSVVVTIIIENYSIS